MRYTVLTYIIGDYEIVHEIGEKDPQAEYVLVTDNPDIRSSTWTVVLDTSMTGCTAMEKCYRIRFDYFKYCHTDICVRIDSSVGVLRSLKPVIDAFEEGGYDASYMLHPMRSRIPDEYDAWVCARGYSREQADRCLAYMSERGYDFNYRGMFQMTCAIQRRNGVTEAINRETFTALADVSGAGYFERIDQTFFSFVVNSRYSDLKIMPLSERLLHSAYLQWYLHGCNEMNLNNVPIDDNDRGYLYMFDKKTPCRYFCPLTERGVADREHELLAQLFEMQKHVKAARKIEQAFFWRITRPFRVVADFLKEHGLLKRRTGR